MVRVPDSESFGKTRAAREGVSKDVRDLQRTDGSQYARALERIRSLISGLDAQVAAAISANSYTKAQIDSKVWPVGQVSGVMAPGQGGTGTANVHSTTSTGTQLQVFVRPDGQLTVGASSERFKQFIADWAPDLAALMSLPTRSFEWRDCPGETDVGLIAEEAYAAGLYWLVRFNGPVIEGIRYERLSVAMLAVTQDLHAQIAEQAQRIDDMEARLSALEEGTAHAA